MKRIFTLIILLSIYLQAFSQTPKMGGRFDKNVWINAKRLAPNVTRGGKEIDDTCSLQKYAPNVHFQGYGDCSAWAAANALTIMDAKQENNQNTDRITNNMYSPAHIFHALKNMYDENNDDCEDGVYIYNSKESNILEFLYRDGCYKREDFELVLKDNYPIKDIKEDDSYCFPDNKLKVAAPRRKINGFYPAITQQGKVNIKLIKEAIFDGKPAISSIIVYKSFGTYDYNSDRLNRPLNDAMIISDYGDTAFHAVIIIGYDDNKFRNEGGFLIMNSWGKGWGRNGFTWFRYSDFKEIACDAYVLDKRPEAIKALAGNIRFAQFPSGSTFNTKKKGNRIITTKNYDGEKMKIFLTANERYYAYVFGSATPTKYITLFPNKGYKAYTGFENSQVEFPEPDSHLIIDPSWSSDIVCILISKVELDSKTIDDFRQALGNNRGNIKTSFLQVFPYQYKSTNLWYNEGSEAYDFDIQLTDKQPIVPITLEVTH
jgi:hypothetical protein